LTDADSAGEEPAEFPVRSAPETESEEETKGDEDDKTGEK
jgi:hypothetical protein